MCLPKGLSKFRNGLIELKIECDYSIKFHEPCALVEMMKKRFSHLTKAEKKMYFDKDGPLSRENIFKLCMEGQERREMFWS